MEARVGCARPGGLALGSRGGQQTAQEKELVGSTAPGPAWPRGGTSLGGTRQSIQN